MTPAGVIRPILPAVDSVNQRAPSGPAAMPPGLLLAVGTVNSVMTPAGVIRPILLPMVSVNQRFPSGPATMPAALLNTIGSGNSVRMAASATPQSPAQD